MMLAFTSTLMLLANAAVQQSPCPATPPTALVVLSNENHVVNARFSDFDVVFNGQPQWTDTELYIFRRGENENTSPQVANMTAPRSAWTLVAGTTDCYRLTTAGTFLYGMAANVEYDLYVRTRKGDKVGAWSNPVPFGREGPLPAPTGVWITP